MKKTSNYVPGGYYLFESLASGKTCYFETEEEILIFRRFLKRYLSKYIKIHKIFTSAEGYNLLLRIRGKGVLIKRYLERCNKLKKKVRPLYIEEPWRIVSEQMRIFHSVYVKAVNKIRDRKGVLVQKRFSKSYFENKEEYEEYENEMNGLKEIEGQKNKKYKVKSKWKKSIRWKVFRGVYFVESMMSREFQNFVVLKLVNLTKLAHSHPI